MAFELFEQFPGLGACVQEAFVPGDADFAAVFGEPGEFDAGGAVLQGDFGHYGEDGGGVAEFCEKLDAFGDGELGCLQSLFCSARTFTS